MNAPLSGNAGREERLSIEDLLDGLLYEYSEYQSRVSHQVRDRDNPPQNLHPERFEKIRARIERMVNND